MMFSKEMKSPSGVFKTKIVGYVEAYHSIDVGILAKYIVFGGITLIPIF